MDALNKQIITSGLDSKLKLWDFYRKTLINEIDLGNPIQSMCYNRVNDLIAVSLSDLSVYIYTAKSAT